MIVVDASALFVAFTEIELARKVWERIGDEQLAAPHLIDAEMASVLRKSVRRGAVPEPVACQALAELAALDLDRYPHPPLFVRVWELQHNVSAYDACYLALAERLDATLLTTDARLARAPGVKCQVEVV